MVKIGNSELKVELIQAAAELEKTGLKPGQICQALKLTPDYLKSLKGDKGRQPMGGSDISQGRGE